MHYKIVALYRNGIEHKSIYMYIGSYMNSYGLTCGFMFSSFVINKKNANCLPHNKFFCHFP